MRNKNAGWKKGEIVAGLSVILLFSLSLLIVVQYSGLPATKHLGGVINIGLALGFVHLIARCDPRWSLYEEIIEEGNVAFAICYAGTVVGACIAAPSSIL